MSECVVSRSLQRVDLTVSPLGPSSLDIYAELARALSLGLGLFCDGEVRTLSPV